MMIEADVIADGEEGPQKPIMAHPPATSSDITLDEWLKKLVPKGRGLKLDFKSSFVVEPAMKIVSRYASQINQPLWLNAGNQFFFVFVILNFFFVHFRFTKHAISK